MAASGPQLARRPHLVPADCLPSLGHEGSEALHTRMTESFSTVRAVVFDAVHHLEASCHLPPTTPAWTALNREGGMLLHVGVRTVDGMCLPIIQRGSTLPGYGSILLTNAAAGATFLHLQVLKSPT